MDRLKQYEKHQGRKTEYKGLHQLVGRYNSYDIEGLRWNQTTATEPNVMNAVPPQEFYHANLHLEHHFNDEDKVDHAEGQPRQTYVDPGQFYDVTLNRA